MKKKFFSTLALIILIISEISIVYADVIIPGQQFHPYSSNEKLMKLNDIMGSPLKEFISILLTLFIVLGLVLVTFRITQNKKQSNENDNSIQILRKIFFGTNVALSLISIYLVKTILFFAIDSNPMASLLDTRAIIAKIFTIVLYVIYIIIMFVVSMISIKKKNKKIVYITSICLTIAILLFCFILINNTIIGYYTYEKTVFDFL